MNVYQADAISGPRCSTLAAMLGEPLAGSASYASTWLAVEQPGPWGREALRESHFDSDVGAELAERVAGTGVRVVLIRRPGSHPDRHRPIPRRVYLAHTAPGRTWLERWQVGDPKELLDLDFQAAGAGVAPGVGDPVGRPLLLVCTNGRRDVCCALMGRPIAAALARVHGEDVWECTHTGGHRFAPTAIALPTGYAYGRLDLPSAASLLEDTEVRVDICRGRSTWNAVGQVAELAVRLATGDTDPDTLTVTTAGEAPVVSHVDGRRWRVAVAERTSPDLRSASCGAKPKPSTRLAVESVKLITA
jgi:hypothetical protein